MPILEIARNTTQPPLSTQTSCQAPFSTHGLDTFYRPPAGTFVNTVPSLIERVLLFLNRHQQLPHHES